MVGRITAPRDVHVLSPETSRGKRAFAGVTWADYHALWGRAPHHRKSLSKRKARGSVREGGVLLGTGQRDAIAGRGTSQGLWVPLAAGRVQEMLSRRTQP